MGKDLKGKELGRGIKQRPDKKYEARFVNRFGDRQSVYAMSLREVKSKLAKAKAADVEKKNVIDPNIKLDAWYLKWLDVYKRPAVRANTIRHYKYVFEHNVQPYIGNPKLTEITRLMVTDVLNKLKEKGYQWESLNKVKILLTDMFERAVDDEFMLKNPAKHIKIPVAKPEHEVKALSKEDQQAFFQCSSGTFYDNLFRVAVSTGLRPGELFALTEDNIDFDKKEIHVEKTFLYQKLEGDTGKTFHENDPKTISSKRVVPMNKYCEEALQRQLILHKMIVSNSPKPKGERTNYIFCTIYGTPLCSQIYADAITRIVKEINYSRDPLEAMEKFSGHCFRHTFATRCFEAGIPPKTVQAYLGHATLQMTMDLYTSVMDKKKTDDMQLLEDTIGLDEIDKPDPNSKIIKLA